ncbi:UDP-N-acetylglucosamine 1-carboxyvinyltransferase 2 [Clostridiales bacterium]|nr:UDP-N-acetylglucosamine 1-carboxyvinyltransferase 2 [Clostridiales bacterium]
MEKLVITGGKRLRGDVFISGAKNAAVAVIPAAIMAGDMCIVDNLPNIEDVASLRLTLNKIGVSCDYIDKHTLKVDSTGDITPCAVMDEVKKIRASYYLLGALLGRYKKAKVAMPGGCDFGTRPIDLHLKGFRMLGARVEVADGIVSMEADRLIGTQLYMDQVSVGATINIMLAASMAEGTTIIENAAKEPHVVDTANFLNMMGANIKGAGTDVIRIKGVEKLHGAEYTIIPDQIEAGTYMIAAAAAGGDVTVRNIIPKHMDSLTAKLAEIGVKVEKNDDSIRVISKGRLESANIKTMSYPGFPTDLQPQMTALLSICNGTSIVTENVWDNRYQYVDELRRLGAKIKVESRTATIEGVKLLEGCGVSATDLRAGAAMIVAGLFASGVTEISNIKYIDRGYEEIEEKLSNIGADIKRVEW